MDIKTKHGIGDNLYYYNFDSSKWKVFVGKFNVIEINVKQEQWKEAFVLYKWNVVYQWRPLQQNFNEQQLFKSKEEIINNIIVEE